MSKSEKKITSVRERLLTAAEILFASYSYHATSVRDITGKANTRTAAINDTFGGKSALFYEVIKRRAEPINQRRKELLAEIPQDLSAQESLHRLLHAFTDPLLEVSKKEDGWRDYLRLIAQMSNSRSPHLANVAEFYNPITMLFIQHMQKIYPDLPPRTFFSIHQHLVANCLSVFADNYRLNVLTQGQFSSSDFEHAYQLAMLYVKAGTDALIENAQKAQKAEK